jgi:hypothetical protein
MDVDEADKKDGAEAVSDAEKDAAAHKLAAEGVARAEAVLGRDSGTPTIVL